GWLERQGHHDRDRGLLRERHDGSRPARLRPGLRPPADVRRGRRHLPAGDAEVQPAGDQRLTRHEGPARQGTHLEDKAAWALEVALDVETSHAMAPMANILLVH